MWDELVKLHVRCAKHEAIDLRCGVCAALVRNGNALLKVKLQRDDLMKEIRALLENKKAIVTNFK